MFQKATNPYTLEMIGRTVLCSLLFLWLRFLSRMVTVVCMSLIFLVGVGIEPRAGMRCAIARGEFPIDADAQIVSPVMDG